MSEPCGTCLGGPDCLPSNDLNLMSLDSTVFPFVTNCAPGLDCFGTGIGAGTISFPVCNQVITRSLPAGLSVSDWLQVISQMLTQAAQLSQFCTQDPPVPPIVPGQTVFLYFNRPQTCSAFCPDGSPFTYTVGAGRVVGFTQQSADAQAYAQACTQAQRNKICLSKIPTLFCVGTAMNVTILASGPLSQFPNQDFWEMVDGTLPTGVTFNGGYSGTGRATITGTPTTDGVYTFTIRVTTSSGSYQQRTYSICLIGIKPTTFPAFTTGIPMSFQLTATADCATPPLSWQIVAGALPAGVTLDESTGVVSGTPTGGFTTVTIKVQTQAT